MRRYWLVQESTFRRETEAKLFLVKTGCPFQEHIKISVAKDEKKSKKKKNFSNHVVCVFCQFCVNNFTREDSDFSSSRTAVI